MITIDFNPSDQLKIQINGYQFPEIDDKDYDGNWLNVYIEIKSKIGNWRTVDPSLLTWELEGIIESLQKTIDGEYDEKKDIDLTFIEPNLEFKIRKESENKVYFRVNFGAESTPKSWNGENACFLEGNISKAEIQKIHDQFAEELRKYPKRV